VNRFEITKSRVRAAWKRHRLQHVEVEDQSTSFCDDCPDREGCGQGIPCATVKFFDRAAKQREGKAPVREKKPLGYWIPRDR